MKAAVAEFEFWTEQAMKSANVGTGDGNRAGGSVCETLGKDFVEVVAHFAFEFELPVSGESEASAQTRKVCVGLGQAKVVGVCADLDVIGFRFLGESRAWDGCDGNGHKCE